MERSYFTESELRHLVVEGSRAIYDANLVQFGEGNLSVRVHGKDEMYITPTLNDYISLTSDEIVHMDFENHQLSPKRSVSSEYLLHVAVYRARPNVNVVIHTHSLYASMLAVAHHAIPPMIEEMVIFLGGGVPITNYAQSGSDELGKYALKTMGTTNSVLLANHGPLIVGRNMEMALKSAQLVEKMAQIYWGAHLMGKVESIKESDLEKFYLKFEAISSTSNSGSK